MSEEYSRVGKGGRGVVSASLVSVYRRLPVPSLPFSQGEVELRGSGWCTALGSLASCSVKCILWTLARGGSASFSNDSDPSLYTAIAELSDKKKVCGKKEIQVFNILLLIISFLSSNLVPNTVLGPGRSSATEDFMDLEGAMGRGIVSPGGGGAGGRGNAWCRVFSRRLKHIQGPVFRFCARLWHFKWLGKMQKCQRECDRSRTLQGGLGWQEYRGEGWNPGYPGRRQKLRGVPPRARSGRKERTVGRSGTEEWQGQIGF